jgi:hypothetical protein
MRLWNSAGVNSTRVAPRTIFVFPRFSATVINTMTYILANEKAELLTSVRYWRSGRLKAGPHVRCTRPGQHHQRDHH